MIKFFKAFNCPGRFFEVLGYITVVIGLIMVIVGIVGFLATPSSYAPDAPTLTSRYNYFAPILMGVITAVVGPQLFFAIAKVVKAAEKYLEEK